MKRSDSWLWIVLSAASAGNVFGGVWLALWALRELTNAVTIPMSIAPLVVIIAAVTGSFIQLVCAWKKMLFGFDYKGREATANDPSSETAEAGAVAAKVDRRRRQRT